MCYTIVYIHEDFWYVVCVSVPSWCVYEAFEHLKIVWDIVSLCLKYGELVFDMYACISEREMLNSQIDGFVLFELRHDAVAYGQVIY